MADGLIMNLIIQQRRACGAELVLLLRDNAVVCRTCAVFCAKFGEMYDIISTGHAVLAQLVVASPW